MRLDPKLFDAAYWYARARLTQGRYVEAINLFERASALRPEDFQSPGFMAQALRSVGREDEAHAAVLRHMRLLEEHLEHHPGDSRAWVLAATGAAALNDAERALGYAQRAIQADPEDPMVLYNIACTCALLGKPGECLDALERSVSNGFADRGWLEHDSDLDSVRADARYLALVRGM